jgi:hypothetical protein
MKSTAKVTLNLITHSCPLCQRPCRIDVMKHLTTFKCESCTTFGVTDTAIALLLGLKKAHRRVLTLVARSKSSSHEFLIVSISRDNSLALSPNKNRSPDALSIAEVNKHRRRYPVRPTSEK